MAGVDSLLKLASQQGADELRLATDEPPRMLQRGGSPLRLSMPPTSDQTLRILLESILTPEREATLRSQGRVQFSYAPEGGGSFGVTLERRGKDTASAEGPLAFEIIFRRGAGSSGPSAGS